jgi:hypothetical protein
MIWQPAEQITNDKLRVARDPLLVRFLLGVEADRNI